MRLILQCKAQQNKNASAYVRAMTSLEETKSCRCRPPPSKDGVSLHCQRPETLLLFRTGHCHTLSCLNSAGLLYVGRWSFDVISSETLPFLLITNCSTLTTQHKFYPQNTNSLYWHLSLAFIFVPVLHLVHFSTSLPYLSNVVVFSTNIKTKSVIRKRWKTKGRIKHISVIKHIFRHSIMKLHGNQIWPT